MKNVLLLSLLLPLFVHAQVSQDVTVPLTATVSESPVSVLVEWPNPTGGNLLLLRRTKGQAGNQWISLINAAGSTLSSYTDQNVVAGQIYEYALRRTTTLDAFGYAHVAVYAPATDSRGKVMVIVDSTTAGALAFELDRLRSDMTGDGWQVTTRQIGSNATVASVKKHDRNRLQSRPAGTETGTPDWQCTSAIFGQYRLGRAWRPPGRLAG